MIAECNATCPWAVLHIDVEEKCEDVSCRDKSTFRLAWREEGTFRRVNDKVSGKQGTRE